ncbi:MAG: hypothetical protein WCD89_05370 [Anaerocolumna sp.]
MDRNRFFAEVTRICALQGITAGEINDGCLPLVFTSSNSPICRISVSLNMEKYGIGKETIGLRCYDYRKNGLWQR